MNSICCIDQLKHIPEVVDLHKSLNLPEKYIHTDTLLISISSPYFDRLEVGVEHLQRGSFNEITRAQLFGLVTRQACTVPQFHIVLRAAVLVQPVPYH